MIHSNNISFDEALTLSEIQNEQNIQMKDLNGNWVKFDKSKVINEFRKAPELQDSEHDAKRIFRYVLYKIEEKLKEIISDEKATPMIGIPRKGIKTCWKTTCVEKYPLKDRLRDVFKQYFCIKEMTFDGSKGYDLQIRNLRSDELISVFCLKYRFLDSDRGTKNYLMDKNKYWYLTISLDTKRRLRETDTSKYAKITNSVGEQSIIDCQQVITIEDSLNPCSEFIHNISWFLYLNYVKLISEIDENIDNVTKFIDTNLNDSLYRTFKIENDNEGSTIIVYDIRTEIFRYIDSSLGRIGKCNFSDYYRDIGMLFRYFNDRFNGTLNKIIEG